MNGLKINEEVVKKSIDVWGIEPQTRQSMEECAELIQAANKQLRGREDKEHLAEEVADVAICLDMLMQMYGIKLEDVQNWVNYKQDRTIRRMQEYEQRNQNQSVGR